MKQTEQETLSAPKMTWTTCDGRELAFALEIEQMLYLEQIRKAVLDENTSSADILNLVFSHDNPFTKASEDGTPRLSSLVMESPAGAMLRDLMFRKQLAEVGMEPEQVQAARHTVSTNEAAEEAGVSVQAIIQGIKAGILAGSKTGGRWMVTRASLDAYVATRGGRPTGKGSMLAIRMGNKPGVSFRIKHDGDFEQLDKTASVITGTLEDWSEVGVLTNLKAKDGGRDSQRFYLLVPGDDVTQVVFEGFCVRGSIEVKEAVYEPDEARAAYKAFSKRIDS